MSSTATGRTVAAALRHVPADGTIGKHMAWHLATALAVIDKHRRNGADTYQTPMLIENWLDRIANRLEIHCNDHPAGMMTVEEFADYHEVPLATVVDWLSAGMPYETAGSWEDGSGFVLCFWRCAEWVALVNAFLHNYGQPEHCRALGMDQWR